MKRSHLVFITLMQLLMVAGCNSQRKHGFASHNRTTLVDQENGNQEEDFYNIHKKASAVDTSSGWNQDGQKILLTGTVYQADGMTPATDVLLYYYHTNIEGKYLHKPEEARSMAPNAIGQTHGYIRGWVKTDANGRYSIYTVMPGTYPTRDEARHVHMTVKEPTAVKEYHIDDFVFDDDVLLTSAKRKTLENRGGSGVLRLVQENEMLVGERNIILGLNIPGYPKKSTGGISSGRETGEDILSFIPYHAWGPDKGTRTCPICKYGWYHGILYFVGNHPDWSEIKQWLLFLEKESSQRGKFLKAYFVYGNQKGYEKVVRERELSRLGDDLQLKNIALTFVPSFTDTESEIDLNKINPQTENTILVYKRSRIIDKFINLKPTEANFKLVSRRLDQSTNEYFNLPKPIVD